MAVISTFEDHEFKHLSSSHVQHFFQFFLQHPLISHFTPSLSSHTVSVFTHLCLHTISAFTPSLSSHQLSEHSFLLVYPLKHLAKTSLASGSALWHAHLLSRTLSLSPTRSRLSLHCPYTGLRSNNAGQNYNAC